MFFCQQLEPLRLGQGALETLDTAESVVLRLVENRVMLEERQHALLTVEDFFGMKELAQFLDGNIGLPAFLPQ